MRKNKFKLPLKLIVIFLGAFLSVVLISGYVLKALRGSDYFLVKEIIFNEDNINGLSYLKGEDIFKINLKDESTYLSQRYPSYRSVRLVRLLPNRIFVYFIKRKPLALVKLYRYFYVDAENVLFDNEAQFPDTKLPLIAGLETKIFKPRSGTKYNLRELSVALDIIKNAARNRLLRGYQIKKIDVASLNNVSFYLGNEITGALEVKINEDNLKDKINLLSGLLAQVKNNLTSIKYIDLRFKEPVIKLKEELNAK